MRYILLLVMVLGQVHGEDLFGTLENGNWLLQPDSMNLAILKLDFQTYVFEGGNFSLHPPCAACSLDSIPFIVRRTPAVDYGDIAFVYPVTGDSVFWATIIWMGQGQILYPETFLPADSFSISQDTVNEPISIEYLQNLGMDPDTFRMKADSAWQVLRELDITACFSQNPYNVGIYLYPPSIGTFDPDPAKWIIFLYQDLTRENVSVTASGSSVPRYVSICNYPNPFNARTRFQVSIPRREYVRLAIYALSGREVKVLVDGTLPAGIRELTWDASKVASGIYFYRLETEETIITRKMAVVK